MPTFKSIKNLAKHISSPKGNATIINQSNIRQALNSEAQRLQAYLLAEIDAYYQSYSPVVYERTGKWLESVRVNPVQQIGNTFSISITFDDEFAYHPSVVMGGEDGYVPWLMEVGWEHKGYSKEYFQTPHFHGFDGTHYIKRAVELWNRTNKFGFVIRVYHGDERYI